MATAAGLAILACPQIPNRSGVPGLASLKPGMEFVVEGVTVMGKPSDEQRVNEPLASGSATGG